MLKLIFGCYTIDGVLRKTAAICVQDIVILGARNFHCNTWRQEFSEGRQKAESHVL